jgi:hypothetical protein
VFLTYVQRFDVDERASNGVMLASTGSAAQVGAGVKTNRRR